MKFTDSMDSVLYQNVDFDAGLIGFKFVWQYMGQTYPYYVEVQNGQCIKRIRINKNMWKLIQRTTVLTPMSYGWRYQRKQHGKNTGKYP